MRSIDDGFAILERLVVRDCYQVDFGSSGGVDNLSRTIALRMDMQVDFEPPATNRLFIGERFYEVKCGRVERCLSPISTPRLPIAHLCCQAREHLSALYILALAASFKEFRLRDEQVPESSHQSWLVAGLGPG